MSKYGIVKPGEYFSFREKLYVKTEPIRGEGLYNALCAEDCTRMYFGDDAEVKELHFHEIAEVLDRPPAPRAEPKEDEVFIDQYGYATIKVESLLRVTKDKAIASGYIKLRRENED